MQSLFVIVIALGAALLPVTSTAQVPQTTQPPIVKPAQAPYVLGPLDEVVVHAIDVPEINDKSQKIDPDGDLRLALVGRIRAAGMTVSQLESELENRLGVYLQQPDVTVTLVNSRSQSVSVSGAVTQPGVKPIDGAKTLLDMLAAAGGLTADAGPVVRVVRRPDQGRIELPGAQTDTTGYSSVEIDARALLEGRTPEKNLVLLANDVVAVPRAELIFVIGEVGRPGQLQLSSKQATTVMEAVSASGGVLRTASSSKARILRRIPGQDARTEVQVDLKKMMQGKANDIPMMTGDILVVPDSSGKRFTTRAVEAAIQVGIMVGSYGMLR